MEYEPRPPESCLRHSATTAGSGSETRRSVVNSNGGPWATAISDKPRVFSSEPPDCWNQKGFNPLVRHFFYVTKKCCCILLVLNLSNSSVDLRRLIPLLLYLFEFLAFGSYLQFFFLQSTLQSCQEKSTTQMELHITSAGSWKLFFFFLICTSKNIHDV